MTEAFKVLLYKLIADDGSGRHLIKLALPGREFETPEALEAEGLIKRQLTHGGVDGDKGACAAQKARHHLANQHQ